MGRMRHNWLLVSLGLVLVMVSVLADALGLGNGDYVFGWEQKLGVLVGTSMMWLATMRLLGWSPRVSGLRHARYDAPVSSASV